MTSTSGRNGAVRADHATLVDAWASSGGQPDAAWLDPAQRIDHIFVSPDVTVEEARYLETEASDHPPLVAEVRCESE